MQKSINSLKEKLRVKANLDIFMYGKDILGGNENTIKWFITENKSTFNKKPLEFLNNTANLEYLKHKLSLAK